MVFATALSLYVGRRNSLDRFSLMPQGLKDRFETLHYPLTTQERQLTDEMAIPKRNWIVMYGDMYPPKFWDENIRKCEIGTGLDRAATTCEVYFTVSQSKYALYSNPSITIEYFPDDLAPNEQLANWFCEFVTTEYNITPAIGEFTD